MSANSRFKRAFTLRRRAAFYADMAAFMGENIPPLPAIEKMEAIARRRRATRPLADMYRRVINQISLGMDMPVAVAKFVPANEAVMLVGSNQAGHDVLRRSLAEMAVLLDRRAKAMRALFKTLFGNLVSLGAIVGVIYFIMLSVVPELTRSITPDMLPRMMLAPYYFAFGRGFVAYGHYIALAILGGGALIAYSLPRWTGGHRWVSRKWFDAHVAPWSLFSRTQATFFLAATAAMMRSGIPLKAVVSDMVPHASPWLGFYLRRMLRDLERGRMEVEALGCGLLPPDTADRLGIYALMSDFTGMMARLSADNFDAFEASIERIGAGMKTATFLLLVSFAAVTMLSFFDYSNALQESIMALRNGLG